MSDASTCSKYNKLSASAREQRAGDIEVQEKALDALKGKLGDKLLHFKKFRDDITITVRPEDLRDVLTFLRDHPELRFNHLSSLTGIDYSRLEIPEEWGGIRFGVVYNLFSMENRANFAVRAVVPEAEPKIPSVFDLWHTADWQEREIFDFFGIEFTEHPDLRRLFLYDDFEGEYPQRKDYPLKGKGERDRSWLKVQRKARGEEV
jgi:NADH-quinone oxidoreductase subunit C